MSRPTAMSSGDVGCFPYSSLITRATRRASSNEYRGTSDWLRYFFGVLEPEVSDSSSCSAFLRAMSALLLADASDASVRAEPDLRGPGESRPSPSSFPYKRETCRLPGIL